MDYESATDEQLINIALHDTNAPAELFAGVVKELMNRGIMHPMKNQHELIDIKHRYKTLAEMHRRLQRRNKKWWSKYYYLKNKGSDSEQIKVDRLLVENNTLRRKLRRMKHAN